MKTKEIIELLQRFDQDTDMEGLNITRTGIKPYFEDRPFYCGVGAFYGAIMGVIAITAFISLYSHIIG
jgi:hypothetical protein